MSEVTSGIKTDPRFCRGVYAEPVFKDGRWACSGCGVPLEQDRQSFTREGYAEYLESPAWQRLRRQALVDAGFRCRGCDSSRSLEAHHRTYERVGSEFADDLTVLCHDCHMAVHTVADARRGVVR